MANYTKSQLIADVMDELGLKEAEHAVSGPDHVKIARVYDQRYESLFDLEMVYWSNTNDSTAEIPAGAYRPMVYIIAGEVAPSYGMETPQRFDDGGRPLPIGALGYRELRRHIARHPSGLPTKAEYF